MLIALVRLFSHNGSGSISGTISVNGVQAQKRVLLFERALNRPVRDAISAVDGSYSFNLIDETKKYYVVSFDDTGSYNAKIADHLTTA